MRLRYFFDCILFIYKEYAKSCFLEYRRNQTGDSVLAHRSEPLSASTWPKPRSRLLPGPPTMFPGCVLRCLFCLLLQFFSLCVHAHTHTTQQSVLPEAQIHGQTLISLCFKLGAAFLSLTAILNEGSLSHSPV